MAKPKLEDCSPSLLRTLLVFAETGNVSRTAEVLDRKQSVISRRLQVFQGPLAGGPLLERQGERRLRLTRRGEEVLPLIREVVARYEELLAHLGGQQAAREVVRVALGTWGAQLYLPAVLAETVGAAWRLEARLERGEHRIAGVAEGKCHLALVTHDPADIKELAGGRPLAIELLAKHPVVALAHLATEAGRELAALPADRDVPQGRLARWPLVGMDDRSGLRRKLEQHLRGRVQVPAALEGQPGGWAVAREYARHRLGVALLPLPLLTAADRADFAVRRLAGTFAVEDWLIARAGDRTAAQAEALAAFRRSATAVARAGR